MTLCQVCYEGQISQLPLIVDKGTGPTLLGRNWLKYIILNWGQICTVAKSDDASVLTLLSKYEQVFQEGLGTYKGLKAHFQVDQNATLGFCEVPTFL